jgi:hypothetical protein
VPVSANCLMHFVNLYCSIVCRGTICATSFLEEPNTSILLNWPQSVGYSCLCPRSMPVRRVWGTKATPRIPSNRLTVRSRLGEYEQQTRTCVAEHRTDKCAGQKVSHQIGNCETQIKILKFKTLRSEVYDKKLFYHLCSSLHCTSISVGNYGATLKLPYNKVSYVFWATVI